MFEAIADGIRRSLLAYASLYAKNPYEISSPLPPMSTSLREAEAAFEGLELTTGDHSLMDQINGVDDLGDNNGRHAELTAIVNAGASCEGVRSALLELMRMRMVNGRR